VNSKSQESGVEGEEQEREEIGRWTTVAAGMLPPVTERR